MNRVPKITLAIIGGSLLIAAAPAPSLGDLFIYDREKILSGELWRLFTGHFVHLSLAHLAWNIAAIAIVGWFIESKRLPDYGILCVFAPCLISATSLVLEPQMHRYAGLSALIMSALAFFALRQTNRATTTILSTLICAKIVFELISQTSLFIPTTTLEIRVAALSHLTGAIVGAAFALIPSCLSRLRWAKQSRPESPDHPRQIQRNADCASGR
jgi:rhomboid family GlyGly-CTERM serine protease